MYKFLCKLKRQILQFDTKSLNKKRYTLLASKLIATKIFIFFHQNKKSQIRYPLKRFFFFKKVKVALDGNANAKIEGVRYLWANWCKENVWLFNQNGLPALSFIHQK